jgi:hypothetical protein
VKKIRPENIAIKGHKNCIFLEKTYLNLFRQDIKKKFYSKHFGKASTAAKKPPKNQILVKNRCRFTAARLKAFFQFFCLDFLHIDPSNNFCFCKVFAKGLKEAER